MRFHRWLILALAVFATGCKFMTAVHDENTVTIITGGDTTTHVDSTITFVSSSLSLKSGPSSCASAPSPIQHSTNPAGLKISWASSNTGVAKVDTVGVVTPVGPGQATITGTLVNRPTVSASIAVTVTDCTPVVTTTIVVAPSTLNLLIGQSNQLTATVTVSSGAIPTPTWTATLVCAQLSATTGNTVTVTGTRACRDSMVAVANGVKAYSIVTVTSGISSIDYTPPGGTLPVGSTQNLTATCVLASGATCTPYWYSKDPSIFLVVGAPIVIVINGITWPAGPTATIKASWHGTTEICVQAAVQDQTIFKCHTWTAP